MQEGLGEIKSRQEGLRVGRMDDEKIKEKKQE